MSDLVEISKGAIILFGTAPGSHDKWQQKLIKIGSTRPGEEETFATHVEIVSVGDALLPGNAGGIRTIGTTHPKLREADLLIHKGSAVKIYEKEGLDDFDTAMMISDLRSRADDPKSGRKAEKYGMWVNVMHGVDYGFNFIVYKLTGDRVWLGMRPMTRLFFGNKSVCSSLVGRAYGEHHSTWFGKNPRLLQPDDIHDWCRDHKNNWKLLYEGVVK